MGTGAIKGIFPQTPLNIFMGRDYHRTFWVFNQDVNGNRSVWDITGYDVTAQIRATRDTGATSLCTVTCTVDDPGDEATGKWTDAASIKHKYTSYFKILLTIADTELAHGDTEIIAASFEGQWDMTLTDTTGDGRVYRGPAGPVTFIQTVVQ